MDRTFAITIQVAIGIGLLFNVDPCFAQQKSNEANEASEVANEEAPAVAANSKPDSEPNSNPKADENSLADRVAKLEKRVEHLERLLFTTAQLTVYDAERRLQDAKTRLNQSERLYRKGALTRAQIATDQFLFRRAERELDLAKATDGHYQITVEIDCLQAEHDLNQARRQLEISQSMLAKGYITKAQILRDETAVDDATKTLDVANQKLEELKRAGK